MAAENNSRMTEPDKNDTITEKSLSAELSVDEIRIFVEAYTTHGEEWIKISKELSGRTPEFIKDWFHSHHQIFQDNAQSDIPELDEIFENLWSDEEKERLEEALNHCSKDDPLRIALHV